MSGSRNLFYLQNKFARLAHRRALRTLVIASAERLKNLFVQAKFAGTLCNRTKHVPKEINSAFVIPTIRGECATHRDCYQLFHTCFQRNMGYCNDGDFLNS